jgi:hypothetical protein
MDSRLRGNDAVMGMDDPAALEGAKIQPTNKKAPLARRLSD